VPDKVRIDKWLWSVRIFKSRTIATDACKKGRISVNNIVVKPSFLVQHDAHVSVRKEGFNLTFRVIDLISKRVSAALAVMCYENLTPDEELNKFRSWYIGKARPEWRGQGEGRPTKRERRDLDLFKDGWFES
jgi:ribosome-associated heat shock protein Hsp15